MSERLSPDLQKRQEKLLAEELSIQKLASMDPLDKAIMEADSLKRKLAAYVACNGALAYVTVASIMAIANAGTTEVYPRNLGIACIPLMTTFGSIFANFYLLTRPELDTLDLLDNKDKEIDKLLLNNAEKKKSLPVEQELRLGDDGEIIFEENQNSLHLNHNG